MEVAIQSAFKITYNGKDVTRDLAPYLTEAVYTDRLTGQADDLDISVADPDGRWYQAWYPLKGVTIKYEYGYAHKPLASAGEFYVDEVELAGPPDTVKIKALAVGLQRQARTRLGKAYDNITLKNLADVVAKRIKAKIVGDIPNIKLTQVTQYGETDWAFLVRIFREYGYEVKLTDNNQTLAVSKIKADAKPIKTIRKSDVKSYTFRDKITEIAKTETRHYDPKKKKLVKGDAQSKDKATGVDVRRKSVSAKTDAEAKAQAEAEQERHEVDKTSLEVTLMGDLDFVAGGIVTVVEWGHVNGEYMITEAKHPINSSAYESQLQLKRIKETAV